MLYLLCYITYNLNSGHTSTVPDLCEGETTLYCDPIHELSVQHVHTHGLQFDIRIVSSQLALLWGGG